MRVLILGASGMLGNAVLRVMSERNDHDVFGALRSSRPSLQALAPNAQLLSGIHVDQPDSLASAFVASRPEVVINCAVLVKQVSNAEDPLKAIPINSLLPHRLARLCELVTARLVHISTDCVFSGCKGNYLETDEADARDLYGRSRLLGEVSYPHAVTLRTSIIGHELNSAHGLIGWFLEQQASIKGYSRAIFSGLPTCELAGVIRDLVLPRPELQGLYHVAAKPISKYELLQLVNQEYGKGLQIEPDDQLKIDRSLNARRFQEATGYQAPPWPQLVAQMRAFQ